MFCLPKFASDEFKKGLKDGTIHPAKLNKMTSKERHDFFAKIVGEENAGPVNASFEQRLLLKNQQAGIIRWAKQVTGLKPEAKRDILSKVERMTTVLEPAELDMFLEDLAARQLGVGVTAEEAQTIVDLARDVRAKEAAVAEGGDRLEWGRAKVRFNNYVTHLKAEAESLKSIGDAARFAKEHPVKALSAVGGQAKSIKASLDLSAILRQGWKTMFTNPVIWFKNSGNVFADAVKTFNGKETLDEVMADIVSRPSYPLMQKAKLAVGNLEEAFPSSLPGKVPYFGKLFKVSEAAYTGFVYRMRADVFDKYLEVAKQADVDVTDKKELESIGNVVNALVGRGKLGPFEPAGNILNNIFFSPRLFASNIQVMTAHRFDSSVSPFARKMAARNLAKIVAGIAVILGISQALDPNSVDNDPRSADVGKIKIGDTRFDMTGGMGSVATLAARLLTFSSKSSTTGKVTALNSGAYGAQTVMDVLIAFLGNKASPIGSVFRDIALGKDQSGAKPTVTGEAVNLFAPLQIATFNELQNDPDAAPILAAMLAEFLGISTNTYGNSPSGIVANHKGEVVQQMLELLTQGNEEGAKDLAHSFNESLKESIRKDIETKDNITDTELLDKKVDTRFRHDAVYMPSAEDVASYKLGSKDIVEKVTNNGRPVVTEDTVLPSKGIIGVVLTYAQAVGTDPVTAFNRIFTGQRISRVTNGTVIVERMSLGDSQQVKKDRGGNTTEMKLDHTLPLELGGSNAEDNLKLVTTAEWESYTPVENYLAKNLSSGKVDKQTAQRLIQEFKNGAITSEEIKAQVNP